MWKEHDFFFNEFKKEHDMTCVILKRLLTKAAHC